MNTLIDASAQTLLALLISTAGPIALLAGFLAIVNKLMDAESRRFSERLERSAYEYFSNKE